jgi:hypothetical protein
MVSIILSLSLVAAIIYVLCKETDVFGKRWDNEYETDWTTGIGYTIYTYLWWAGFLGSMALSYFLDDWSFREYCIVFIGTTLLYALLVGAWSVIRKERVDMIYHTYLLHSPDEIIKAIGGQITQKEYENEYERTVYQMAFQGGNYRVDYSDNNLNMTISMVFESVDIIQTYQIWLDNINVYNRYVGAAWKCSLHKSNEESIGIRFSCEVPVMGRLQNIKDYVLSIISDPYHAAREIQDNVHRDIQKYIDEQNKQHESCGESEEVVA